MKTKLLFLVLVMFVAFGCKTVKQTEKTKAEAKTELNADVKTEAESKAAVETKTVSTDKGITDVSTNTKVTETEFSAPDANGKQFPIKQKVTEQSTNLKKIADAKVDNQTRLTTENKTKVADKTKAKSSSKVKVDTKTTTEIETPGIVSFSIILLVLGILGLIYLVLKRFKVVK